MPITWTDRQLAIWRRRHGGSDPPGYVPPTAKEKFLKKFTAGENIPKAEMKRAVALGWRRPDPTPTRGSLRQPTKFESLEAQRREALAVGDTTLAERIRRSQLGEGRPTEAREKLTDVETYTRLLESGQSRVSYIQSQLAALRDPQREILLPPGMSDEDADTYRLQRELGGFETSQRLEQDLRVARQKLEGLRRGYDRILSGRRDPGGPLVKETVIPPGYLEDVEGALDDVRREKTAPVPEVPIDTLLQTGTPAKTSLVPKPAPSMRGRTPIERLDLPAREALGTLGAQAERATRRTPFGDLVARLKPLLPPRRRFATDR